MKSINWTPFQSPIHNVVLSIHEHKSLVWLVIIHFIYSTISCIQRCCRISTFHRLIELLSKVFSLALRKYGPVCFSITNGNHTSKRVTYNQDCANDFQHLIWIFCIGWFIFHVVRHWLFSGNNLIWSLSISVAEYLWKINFQFETLQTTCDSFEPTQYLLHELESNFTFLKIKTLLTNLCLLQYFFVRIVVQDAKIVWRWSLTTLWKQKRQTFYQSFGKCFNRGGKARHWNPNVLWDSKRYVLKTN